MWRIQWCPHYSYQECPLLIPHYYHKDTPDMIDMDMLDFHGAYYSFNIILYVTKRKCNPSKFLKLNTGTVYYYMYMYMYIHCTCTCIYTVQYTWHTQSWLHVHVYIYIYVCMMKWKCDPNFVFFNYNYNTDTVYYYMYMYNYTLYNIHDSQSWLHVLYMYINFVAAVKYGFSVFAQVHVCRWVVRCLC